MPVLYSDKEGSWSDEEEDRLMVLVGSESTNRALLVDLEVVAVNFLNLYAPEVVASKGQPMIKPAVQGARECSQYI